MLHLCVSTKVGTALGLVATTAVATNDPCYTGIATSHNKFYFIFFHYLFIYNYEGAFTNASLHTCLTRGF